MNTYQCPLSSNIIEIKIENDVAYFENSNIDERHIKLFVLLLSDCINDLKKKNITKIIQNVDQDSWELYLSANPKWNLLRIDPYSGAYIIECSIDSALENIVSGFGFVCQ